MKQILIAAVLAAYWQSEAAEPVWLTDLPIAEARARAENKLVLVDFTGSDWCPGCVELGKKVFESSRFGKYAATNLVLVTVDFPEKHPQSRDLKKANAALQEQFKVEGYPTLVVLNKDGHELGREEGYAGEGPKEIIAALEKFKTGKQ